MGRKGSKRRGRQLGNNGTAGGGASGGAAAANKRAKPDAVTAAQRADPDALDDDAGPGGDADEGLVQMPWTRWRGAEAGGELVSAKEEHKALALWCAADARTLPKPLPHTDRCAHHITLHAPPSLPVPPRWACNPSARGHRRKKNEFTNAMFEAYYRRQDLFPEAEWPRFLQTLRRPLPATFRLNPRHPAGKRLL